MEIEGRRILVTGGARRLGRALCLAFAERGGRPAVHHHTAEAEARKVADRCGGAPVLQADLTTAAEAERLVAAAREQLGGLDILVNNAAVYEGRPLEEVDEEHWDRHLDLNLKGAFFCARAAGLAMKEEEGGVIVNLTDALARRPRPGHLPYYASKAALEALTAGLALELAPRVRVVGVAPGPVLPAEGAAAEEVAALGRSTLLGRVGGAEAVVSAVLFLVENDFVTGQVLAVDGGRTLL